MGNGDRVRATGSCLCGGVRFSIGGPLHDVSYCHCIMCQRAATHFVAYTACDDADLAVTDPQRRLKWYRSSPIARRGFCGKCGANLFWKRDAASYTSVSAGSLDQPTGLRPGKHIFLEHTADYDRDLPMGDADPVASEQNANVGITSGSDG